METPSSILAWKIPLDRGAWWATIHGVTKIQTRLRHTYASIYVYAYIINICIFNLKTTYNYYDVIHSICVLY